jgi:hypothetical protein
MNEAMVSRDAIAKRGTRIRGYEADVMQSVTRSTGTHVFIPRPEYDRLRHKYGGPPPGAGTEMKALLAKIGIVASPTCSCNKRAKVMDEKGCDWCEEHIEEIDGWLAEEAKKRKLPYLSLAGKALIHLAIRRARKKGNSR